MYELDWDDGDEEDRVKGGLEVKAGKREFGREGKGACRRGAGASLKGGAVEGGVGEGVCGVCMGAGTAYRLIPCGHHGVCEGCGEHEGFFDEVGRPFGACGVCGVEMEEPYFVRAETLEGYRVYYP